MDRTLLKYAKSIDAGQAMKTLKVLFSIFLAGCLHLSMGRCVFGDCGISFNPADEILSAPGSQGSATASFVLESGNYTGVTVSWKEDNQVMSNTHPSHLISNYAPHFSQLVCTVFVPGCGLFTNTWTIMKNSPQPMDLDGDLFDNDWEIENGFDPNFGNDPLKDTDGDGLTDFQEYILGTNPREPDTDGDGISDGLEVSKGLPPTEEYYYSDYTYSALGSILLPVGTKSFLHGNLINKTPSNTYEVYELTGSTNLVYRGVASPSIWNTGHLFEGSDQALWATTYSTNGTWHASIYDVSTPTAPVLLTDKQLLGTPSSIQLTALQFYYKYSDNNAQIIFLDQNFGYPSYSAPAHSAKFFGDFIAYTESPITAIRRAPWYIARLTPLGITEVMQPYNTDPFEYGNFEFDNYVAHQHNAIANSVYGTYTQWMHFLDKPRTFIEKPLYIYQGHDYAKIRQDRVVGLNWNETVSWISLYLVRRHRAPVFKKSFSVPFVGHLAHYHHGAVYAASNEQLYVIKEHSGDSDGNGFDDMKEQLYFGGPLVNTTYDSDGDGISDGNELLIGSNPNLADSDNDGLSDWDEFFIWGTNVNNPDTDGDGVMDGFEVERGYSPRIAQNHFPMPPNCPGTTNYQIKKLQMEGFIPPNTTAKLNHSGEYTVIGHKERVLVYRLTDQEYKLDKVVPLPSSQTAYDGTIWSGKLVVSQPGAVSVFSYPDLHPLAPNLHVTSGTQSPVNVSFRSGDSLWFSLPGKLLRLHDPSGNNQFQINEITDSKIDGFNKIHSIANGLVRTDGSTIYFYAPNIDLQDGLIALGTRAHASNPTQIHFAVGPDAVIYRHAGRMLKTSINSDGTLVDQDCGPNVSTQIVYQDGNIYYWNTQGLQVSAYDTITQQDRGVIGNISLLNNLVLSGGQTFHGLSSANSTHGQVITRLCEEFFADNAAFRMSTRFTIGSNPNALAATGKTVHLSIGSGAILTHRLDMPNNGMSLSGSTFFNASVVSMISTSNRLFAATNKGILCYRVTPDGQLEYMSKVDKPGINRIFFHDQAIIGHGNNEVFLIPIGSDGLLQTAGSQAVPFTDGVTSATYFQGSLWLATPAGKIYSIKADNMALLLPQECFTTPSALLKFIDSSTALLIRYSESGANVGRIHLDADRNFAFFEVISLQAPRYYDAHVHDYFLTPDQITPIDSSYRILPNLQRFTIDTSNQPAIFHYDEQESLLYKLLPGHLGWLGFISATLENADMDDLPDYIEYGLFGSLASSFYGDADGDGLLDWYEAIRCLDFDNEDSDGDGIIDVDEILVHGTNPLNADSDGDGMPDGFELLHGLQALSDDAHLDYDNDGFLNIEEYIAGTNPQNELSFLSLKLIPSTNEFSVLVSPVSESRIYRIQERSTIATNQTWQTRSVWTNSTPMQSFLVPLRPESSGSHFRIGVELLVE